ncbi:uncharacterized protein [Onthophagus taurus]|uniref:uncharacterized protein isoform X1 n=1 Tax=Onthophagus taurus TaxID=166361 RepID=UPI0039BDA52E
MGNNFVFILLLFFLMAHGYHHVSEYSSNISYEDINDGESIIERFVRRVRSVQEDYTNVKTIRKVHEIYPEQERYKRSSDYFSKSREPILIDSFSDDDMVEDPNFKDAKLKDTILEDSSLDDESLEDELVADDTIEDANLEESDVNIEKEDAISEARLIDVPKMNVTFSQLFGDKLLNSTTAVDKTTKKTGELLDCCVGDEIFPNSTEAPLENRDNSDAINPSDRTLKIKIVLQPKQSNQSNIEDYSPPRRSRQLLMAIKFPETEEAPSMIDIPIGLPINPTLPDAQTKEAFPFIQIEEIPTLPDHGFSNPVPVISLAIDHFNTTSIKNTSNISESISEDSDIISDSLSHPLQLFDLDVKANPTDSLEPKSRKRHNINNMIRFKRSVSDSTPSPVTNYKPTIASNYTLLVNNNNNIENDLQENKSTESYVIESIAGPRQGNLSLSTITPSIVLFKFKFGTAYLRPNPLLSPQSTYPEKVSTGVNVEETQKNPERRIYGYVGV